MKPTLLIMAAGMGSRYGGLKQLDPVGPNGETIIDFSVFDAIRAGFGKLVFVIRRDIEQPFREAFGDKFEDRIQVEYAFQELDLLPEGFTVPSGRQKPWGTGHAILIAKSHIREPFGVINADDFYGASSFQALHDRLCRTQDSADYCMLGYVLHNTLSDHGSVSRGVCERDDAGNLKHIVELKQVARTGDAACYTADDGQTHALTGNETVSMNMWGFTPALFDHLQQRFVKFLEEEGTKSKSELLIPTVIAELIAAGKAVVSILPTAERWFGVTFKEDKTHVVENIQALFDKDQYPVRLWMPALTGSDG